MGGAWPLNPCSWVICQHDALSPRRLHNPQEHEDEGDKRQGDEHERGERENAHSPHGATMPAVGCLTVLQGAPIRRGIPHDTVQPPRPRTELVLPHFACADDALIIRIHTTSQMDFRQRVRVSQPSTVAAHPISL